MSSGRSSGRLNFCRQRKKRISHLKILQESVFPFCFLLAEPCDWCEDGSMTETFECISSYNAISRCSLPFCIEWFKTSKSTWFTLFFRFYSSSFPLYPPLAISKAWTKMLDLRKIHEQKTYGAPRNTQNTPSPWHRSRKWGGGIDKNGIKGAALSPRTTVGPQWVLPKKGAGSNPCNPRTVGRRATACLLHTCPHS